MFVLDWLPSLPFCFLGVGWGAVHLIVIWNLSWLVGFVNTSIVVCLMLKQSCGLQARAAGWGEPSAMWNPSFGARPKATSWAPGEQQDNWSRKLVSE